MAAGPPQDQGAASATSPPGGNGRKQQTRELSQTKRAAQNRAAQRAFRHRKETYIRQLEEQNKNFLNMEKAYKGLQSENYALRDYVITLQARLLDATGDFPPPPPNVNINAPNTQQPQEHGMPEQQHEQQQPQAKWGASPLEAVARAVADLAAEGEHQHGDKPPTDVEMKEESRPADDQSQQPVTQA